MRFGLLGLRELVEPELRRLVAGALGVGPELLVTTVSFEQDLAADALDRLHLAILAEHCFGVTIPESAIERVQTYGDLVDAVVEARLGRDGGIVPTAPLRVTIRSAGRGAVLRTGWLTPYLLETIVADARRAGSETQVDIEIPPDVASTVVGRIRDCFAGLTTTGVTVAIREDRQGRLPVRAA